MTWKIALFEFKLQRRSLIYWGVLILLLAFLISEVVLPGQQMLMLGHSTAPAPVVIEGEVVDWAAELHAALQTGSFGQRFGWLLYDRIVLLSTLLMSLFTITVWERDKRHHMEALIQSRNVPVRQYTTGKFIGLMLTYGSQLLVIFAVATISSAYITAQWDEPFSPIAILAPILSYGLITLLYSIAFILFVSLIINNTAATFLLHFIYWIYCVTKIGTFSTASRLNFMTQWMIRFDGSMDVNLPQIIAERFDDLLINRGIYLIAASLLLIAVSWYYQRRSTDHAG